METKWGRLVTDLKREEWKGIEREKEYEEGGELDRKVEIAK